MGEAPGLDSAQASCDVFHSSSCLSSRHFPLPGATSLSTVIRPQLPGKISRGCARKPTCEVKNFEALEELDFRTDEHKAQPHKQPESSPRSCSSPRRMQRRPTRLLTNTNPLQDLGELSDVLKIEDLDFRTEEHKAQPHKQPEASPRSCSSPRRMQRRPTRLLTNTNPLQDLGELSDVLKIADLDFRTEEHKAQPHEQPEASPRSCSSP